MLVKDECSSWYNRVGNFFLINLEEENTVIVHQQISMLASTNQLHSFRVRGQWH